MGNRDKKTPEQGKNPAASSADHNSKEDASADFSGDFSDPFGDDSGGKHPMEEDEEAVKAFRAGEFEHLKPDEIDRSGSGGVDSTGSAGDSTGSGGDGPGSRPPSENGPKERKPAEDETDRRPEVGAANGASRRSAHGTQPSPPPSRPQNDPNSLWLPDRFRGAAKGTVDCRQGLALTAAYAAGCAARLPNTEIYYSDRRLALNLYSVTIGASGSGKGVLSPVRQNIEAASGETPAVVSPDASAEGLLEALGEYPHALLFSEEIQTMIRPIKHRWGSEQVLLKGFHQETVETRRSGGNRVQVSRPAPSLILAGEPEDARELLDLTTDGFRSRCLFVTLKPRREWRSQFGTRQEEATSPPVKRLAELLEQAHAALSDRKAPLRLEPTKAAARLIDEAHEEIMASWRAEDIDGYDESLKRSGLQAFRIAAILTVLEAAENGADLRERDVLDVGVRAARSGTKISLGCLYYEITFCRTSEAEASKPKLSSTGLRGEARKLFSLLPAGQVDFEQAGRLAIRQLDMPRSEVERHLDDFARRGLLQGWNGKVGYIGCPPPQENPRNAVHDVWRSLGSGEAAAP